MRSRRSSDAPVGIATKAIYGLVASVVLFSLSVAMQRTFFGPAPEAGDDLRRPESRAGLRPASGAAGSSDGEDDGALDPEAAGADRSHANRRPASWQNDGEASHAAETAGSRSSRGNQAASDSPDRSWSSRLSAVASLFSFGGGGSAGAPATTASSSSATPQPDRAQVREVFFGTREETACQPGDRRFVLNDVPDLYVCVVWAGVAGKYVEQLTFVSPDGHVYQTLTVPFVTANSAFSDPTIEIEGRRLVARPAGWGANGEALVTAALPVAGTFISQRLLAGLWTVQVGLNGQVVTQDNFELVAP
jgi:hypothetical protein